MPEERSVVFKRDVLFPKRKIPIVFIVFFLFFQAVGLDFGFSSVLKRKYRLTVQRTTLFLSILMSVVMLVYLAFLYNDVWCWFTAGKYTGFIWILITTKYKLYHLVYDINGICDLTTKQIKILIIINILYMVLINLVRVVLLTYRCNWESETYCRRFGLMFYFVVYVGIMVSLETIAVMQVITTYYFKCGVNRIKVLLKRPIRQLKAFEKSYIAIADCYDKIRPCFDWMTALKLGVTVPEIMGTIWSCTLYIKGNGQWFSYVAEFVLACHLTIQVCVPAIVVELLNSEMDATIQLLNQEIMEETDKREIENLKRVLHYIKKRPLRHLIWRFIPIDLRLVLTLFSLCTSYFIVALQFSQII